MMPPAKDAAAPAAAPDPTRLQLSPDALAQWRDDIGKAESVRKTYEPWMESVLRDYVPSAKDTPDTYASEVHTLRAFILVERKKADYFYQRPDVSQVPSPLMDGPIPGIGGAPGPDGKPTGQIPMTAAVEANEEIVNELLGPAGIDAKKLAHEVLFDVLATYGQGWTCLGYDSVTKDTPTPDPLTGLERSVPVPIYERIYWDYIPPKQTLKPADFRSTNWDLAPWLGYKFTLPLTAANRKKFKLPDEFTGSPDDASQHFDFGTAATNASARKVFTGTVIWYKSSLYRDDILHPEHYTQLVLVDGMTEPSIHQDSPNQTFDDRGRLTPDSLLGNPIHPFSIRSLTDSAFPPSDAMVIKPLENELNRFRSQMVESRDAMILRWMYNTGVLPPDSLSKIVRSPIGGMIGVPAEAFVGEGSIKELPHGSFPRESFTSNDYVDSDIARAGGVDASGAGIQGSTQTATAEQRQQANANARFDFERGVFLDRYLAGVTKFAQLVMRWLPLERAVQIVGPQKAQWWEAFRKQIPAPIAFTALPDSALRTDQATDRAQAKELYSFLAQDPYIQKGRAKLLEKLLRKYHIDPTGIVNQPDPPHSEPAKLSISIKMDDFVLPQGPITAEIANQLGLKISPETVQLAMALQQQSVQLAAEVDATKAAAKAEPNTKHGGMVAPQESLSKHASDKTGGMQGTGAAAPLGTPGGMVQ